MLSDINFCTLIDYIPNNSIWNIHVTNRSLVSNSELISYFVPVEDQYNFISADFSILINNDSKIKIKSLIIEQGILTNIVHQYINFDRDLLFVSFDYTASCFVVTKFLPDNIEKDFLDNELVEYATLNDLQGL